MPTLSLIPQTCWCECLGLRTGLRFVFPFRRRIVSRETFRLPWTHKQAGTVNLLHQKRIRLNAMRLMYLLAFALYSGAAIAQTETVRPEDPRFCGEPLRTVTGSIYRNPTMRARFVRMHPCPATGEVTGACPGWAVDHVIPLSCGGCDDPVNMQWLPLTIKSCSGTQCKDRWERRVYETTVPCR